ncbi:hypothetical protein [Aeromicrobium fastidiosum]|uniref:DUF2384 domain-containing protein n=1 Tax=Aeromicrobium fastidiosum TaxID=52699 RepID=A0A641AL38_9ACTN|nr:hypothetical protein [Aeromicrobium fastidiosum]KAA1376400.1 hypothetical protein ESP62_013295 [Aeromicrobium fastidiosum]MBP2391692.1 hypothetical protein [Aeromicrobium fastidiosum]
MTDPTEKWRQAFRDLQARLLESGVLDLETLRSQRRDPNTAATADWARTQGSAVLVLADAAGPVYPTFQFTDTGDLRPELAPHVAVLQDAGLSPWLVWAWLTEPVALLSGDVPEQIMVTNPRRAGRAVRRYADRYRVGG